MATGPCQAGFAETHNYIYFGGDSSSSLAVRAALRYSALPPCMKVKFLYEFALNYLTFIQGAWRAGLTLTVLSRGVLECLLRNSRAAIPRGQSMTLRDGGVRGADDNHDTATNNVREASERTATRGLVARHSVSRSQFTGGT
jgi:hypothetical protein